ncbi:hypothetical protein A33M_2468 [Rhodovulum sp. PH10]|uniref:TIGR03808 family TAT-translocated repetitive protein n=1 Tax=Rhodovulum sp. PH10 TaxID=1187851 RepID=UPI00027C2846|nr:TIGR03808 family TAT-translocated repetitive protein [Rhodovulum sp. PH10]EJW13608.1 hypothetical protein A33M_2468 [Rhodovulum sp. PH10]
MIRDGDDDGGPDHDRRAMLLAAGIGAGLGAGLTATAFASPAGAAPRKTNAAAGPISAYGIDGGTLGLTPGSPLDQTQLFQRALDRAAAAGSPLALPPGVYRVGGLRLPDGTRLVAAPGSVRLELTEGASLLSAANSARIALDGLVLDGQGKPLPDDRGLLHCENVERLAVTDCDVVGAGATGIHALACGGEILACRFTDTADVAIVTRNARHMVIARNTIAGAGNAGIQVLRWEAGEDGTLVADNHLTRIRNRDGGTGQFGNAINIFRANGVIVRGNRVHDCAFSGVRGNSASNLQIVGNTVTKVGETALYSEFSFEASIVSGNIVDGAQTGVAIANFADGGRIAVVQGNILRNLAPGTVNPDPEFPLGVGIGIEADSTAVGNVIERATAIGIGVGWGRYVRDVALTGNVVRDSGIGIGVTVADGAGPVLISGNLISGSRIGAIVGLDHKVPVTGDLSADNTARFSHLAIIGNKTDRRAPP